MTWLRETTHRLVALFRRKQLEASFDEELRAHLELLDEENVRRGMSAEEARFAALRGFGGVERTKEEYRDRRGLPMIETLAQDVRYAWRQLRRAPGFAAVAILTLALGIGADTAILSVVNTVLLQPLPYKDADRLLMVWRTNPKTGSEILPLSPADFADLKEENRVFEGMAGSSDDGYALTGL